MLPSFLASPLPSAPSGKPGKAAAAPKGRAKKPATSPVLWDWPLSRDKALQAMLTGIRAESSALFDGAHEQSRMVDVCVHAVRGEGRRGGRGHNQTATTCANAARWRDPTHVCD